MSKITFRSSHNVQNVNKVLSNKFTRDFLCINLVPDKLQKVTSIRNGAISPSNTEDAAFDLIHSVSTCVQMRCVSVLPTAQPSE